ncbi:MAG: alanine dehydrogenase [Methylomonas sp.]|nr:alanine dehydrogenase [Methylomonas sp.]PPD19602.1 MAG: alanine dehydrogenase [Methylomonas sp.]PPD25706.1 MAG: alanine dehydrogenase [Methylomonas sp.]PPD36917.1 MAG: alanine dehydrogenase [Methylomonas sp.]PPD38705.1 MAG: alanine dehydrogenase [Methylomonas sp.]
MKLGVIKESKTLEHRVGLTPGGVVELVVRGHQVQVEHDAGTGSGFTDEDYRAAGASIVDTATAWDNELVVKIKEPIESEYGYLQQQIVFTFFHLAGVPRALTETLLAAGTCAVAYETVEDGHGRLPLLAPMSAMAGNMAVQMGAHYLATCNGGKGVMLGQVLGRRHGRVLVIGDGVVGQHAARTAIGLGANVAMVGLFPDNAGRIHRDVSPAIAYFISSAAAIAEQVGQADLVVGAVLIHGARAAHVVSEAMVRSMQPGSVIVDVSIDQGGCIETAQVTTHANPVFVRHDVIHYCVSNMPGVYPRTATLALTDATLPYVLRLADQGIDALKDDSGFAKGLNTRKGYLTCKPVAEALGLLSAYRDIGDSLSEA